GLTLTAAGATSLAVAPPCRRTQANTVHNTGASAGANGPRVRSSRIPVAAVRDADGGTASSGGAGAAIGVSVTPTGSITFCARTSGDDVLCFGEAGSGLLISVCGRADVAGAGGAEAARDLGGVCRAELRLAPAWR